MGLAAFLFCLAPAIRCTVSHAKDLLSKHSAFLQVDFSQSVYHLWKDIRKFGKAGSAQSGKDANAHEGGAKANMELAGGRLELKVQPKSQVMLLLIELQVCKCE